MEDTVDFTAYVLETEEYDISSLAAIPTANKGLLCPCC